MVTKHSSRPAPARRRRGQNGWLHIDLLAALGILLLAILPLGFACFQEFGLLRRSYHKSVAMELIDGEMEILAAGEWRQFPAGRQEYPLRGDAVTNLPPGTAFLTISNQTLRLEWQPANGKTGTRVVREGVGR